MMENFQYYAPTKVVFGKGTENKAGQACQRAKLPEGAYSLTGAEV